MTPDALRLVVAALDPIARRGLAAAAAAFRKRLAATVSANPGTALTLRPPAPLVGPEPGSHGYSQPPYYAPSALAQHDDAPAPPRRRRFVEVTETYIEERW